MADKTVIVEIKYDTDQAVESLKDLTSAVEGEKVAQAKLKDELQKGKISQVEYAEEIEKSKNTVSKANAERKNTIQLLSSEKGSIDQLKAQIKKLTIERNKLNQNTEEGRKKSQAYNAQIENLNKALKTSQKETGKTTGAFGNFTNSLKSLPGPIGGVVNGIGGMTKAAIKFIATPLGAILAAIAIVVQSLIKAFKRSEDRMTSLNVIGAKLGGVFKGIQKALEPVVDFIVKNVIVAFDALGKAVDKTISFVGNALKKLGFDKAAAAVENYTDKIKATAQAAGELAQKEADLVKAQREARLIQLEYQKDAEKLRQIRDDESKSIDERIKANEKLGAVLKEQLQQELRIANLALEVANKRIEVDGETTDALNQRAEALTNIADIQERITGQESEQLVNINSLLKERADLEKEQAEIRGKKIAELGELKKIEVESEQERFERAMENAAIQMQQDFENKLNHDAMIEQLQAEHDQRMSEMRQVQVDEAYYSMQEIINATAGMAGQRVTIISDAFSKIATINLKEVKSAKDAYTQIGMAAAGLTNLIIAGQQAQLADLEAQKASELKAAGDNVLAKEVIERRFNRKLVALKKQQFTEDKVKALADASISTFLGVTKALGSAAPPANFILAGIVGALGGLNIGLIARQQPPSFSSDKVFGEGGAIVNGASHSGGGVDVFGNNGQYFGNVEGDEAMFVMKKDATAEIAAYSKINESFGGRSFAGAQGAGTFTDGGQMDGVNINRIVDEAIERKPIFVRVGEIETGLTDYKNVKSAGVV